MVLELVKTCPLVDLPASLALIITGKISQHLAFLAME
jgi:hypothetical protein